jgi:hypothetical protein
MLAKFSRPVLAISLFASLVAMLATANAGATISDKGYWPSEVGPSAYRAVDTQHAPHDAFAAIGRTASAAVASAPAEEDTWHYVVRSCHRGAGRRRAVTKVSCPIPS